MQEETDTLERIGSELMLEVKGVTKAFRKLFYNCLLCNVTAETDIEKVSSHKRSNQHRIKFLELYYPSLALALKTRSSSNLTLILIHIFYKIYAHHSKDHDWSEIVSPHMSIDCYSQSTDDNFKQILNESYIYKSTDPFIDVTKKFIETVSLSDMECDLTDAELKALHGVIVKRLGEEAKKIQKNFAKIQKRPQRHQEYLNQYRRFYLEHSFHYANVTKQYDYIEPFKKYFEIFLKVEEERELYTKIKEIAMEVKEQEKQIKEEKVDDGLENISEDSECEIIEKKIEVVDVSSDDDEDEDIDKPPPAKKRKLQANGLEDIPDSTIHAAILIAHDIIKKGRKPTIDGIRSIYPTCSFVEGSTGTPANSCFNPFSNNANRDTSNDFFTYSPVKRPKHEPIETIELE